MLLKPVFRGNDSNLISSLHQEPFTFSNRFFLDFRIKSYIMRKLRSIVSDCQSGRKLSEMPLLSTFHNNFERIVFLGTVLLILLCIPLHSTVQDNTSTNPPPVLTAAKLTDTPPHIDGNLDEDRCFAGDPQVECKRASGLPTVAAKAINSG